jgi:UDP-N-acetylmuramoyl-L-alanyl-D-glutamate--2,6-diaminopimelate ligase
MKSIIKKITPEFMISWYHYILAFLGALIYGFPSNKLIVIGVTGTKGKSSTCNLIWHIFAQDGLKAGLTSTANFRIGDKEWVNDKKQTMLGRFQLQKLLKQMVKAGCKYAVIETSSEGIKQSRHKFINYDIAVFTNLSPEHIEAHGSFKKYKIAKGNLFAKLSKDKKKKINGKAIDKAMILNVDDKNYKYFAEFKADKKFGFGIENEADLFETTKAKVLDVGAKGSRFEIQDMRFEINLLGEFNIYNCLTAITTAQSQGIDLQTCKTALEKIKSIPGRMEVIDEGQNFTVVVDYAYEPKSLEWVYQTLKPITSRKLIGVLGACGGGRDKWRIPVLGSLSAKYCEYAIFTTDDPYDDDLMELINGVAKGADEYLEKYNKNELGEDIKDFKYEKIVDRKQGIKRALEIAKPGDCVIISGKGSEPVMAVAKGKKIPWDDREVVRELLRK